METQKLNRELLDCLHSETRRCTHSISQAQKETELITVNSIITEVSKKLENKLESNSAKTNSVLTDLNNKIVKDAETEDKLERQTQRQKKLAGKCVNSRQTQEK